MQKTLHITNQMGKSRKINDLARKKLNTIDYRCWMAYVYGLMSSRMTETDLENMENMIKMLGGE